MGNLIGWRTVVFNTIIVLLAGVRMQYPDMVLPDDEEVAKYVDAVFLLIAGSGNLWLRFVTKGPVGEKPNA